MGSQVTRKQTQKLRLLLPLPLSLILTHFSHFSPSEKKPPKSSIFAADESSFLHVLSSGRWHFSLFFLSFPFFFYFSLRSLMLPFFSNHQIFTIFSSFHFTRLFCDPETESANKMKMKKNEKEN